MMKDTKSLIFCDQQFFGRKHSTEQKLTCPAHEIAVAAMQYTGKHSVDAGDQLVQLGKISNSIYKCVTVRMTQQLQLL